MESLTIENTKQNNSIINIFNRGIQSISNYFDPQLKVQEYLNSLPSTTTSIDISFRRLTYIPSLMRFTNLKKLNCSCNSLTEAIEVPQSLEVLHCQCNSFDRYLFKNNTNITNLKVLNCSNNYLQYIMEPIEINYYIESNKLLHSLILPLLPESLVTIDCKRNRLRALGPLYIQSFPNLKKLDCSFNKLQLLPTLPLDMDELFINNNTYFQYSVYSQIKYITYFNAYIEYDCNNEYKKYPISMKDYLNYYGKTCKFELESNMKEENKNKELTDKELIENNTLEIDKLKFEISELKTLLETYVKKNEIKLFI